MPRSERTSVIRRPKWSPEEDAQLIRLVEEHGVGNWAAISRDLKSPNNRDKKAVRSRWVYQLDPNVNKGPFTTEEENIIFEQYEKVGAHWAEISKALPGRTDGAIKNYWNGHLIKKLPYRKFVKKGKRSKRKPGRKSASMAEEPSTKEERVIRGPVCEKLGIYTDFDFGLNSEATSKRPKQEEGTQSGPEGYLKSSDNDWGSLWYPAGTLPNTAATPTTHWGYTWGNDFPHSNPLYPWGVQNWMKDYANICNSARRNDQRGACQTAEGLLERAPSTELD